MKANPRYNHDTNEIVSYEIMCPGCGHLHAFYVSPFYDQMVWGFNGNTDKPTFTPSLLNENEIRRCHVIVTDGIANFCTDCSHGLAGQSVELPDFK